MASPHRVQCGRNPSRAPLAQTTRRSGAGWGWAVGIEPGGFLWNGVVHEVSPLAVEGHAAQIEQGTGRRAGSMHPGPFRPALESRSLQPRHRRRQAALPPSAPIRGRGPTSAGYGSGRTSPSPSPRTSSGTPTPPTCSTPGPNGWISRPCWATRASPPPGLTPTSGRKGWRRWWQSCDNSQQVSIPTTLPEGYLHHSILISVWPKSPKPHGLG
jgi:hypothetical protein